MADGNPGSIIAGQQQLILEQLPKYETKETKAGRIVAQVAPSTLKEGSLFRDQKDQVWTVSGLGKEFRPDFGPLRGKRQQYAYLEPFKLPPQAPPPVTPPIATTAAPPSPAPAAPPR